MDRQTFTVTETDQGKRLDLFLSESCGLTRTRTQDLLSNHWVVCQGRSTWKANFRVTMGQQWMVTVPPLQSTELTPQEIPLDIVFEDSQIVVLNKPVNLVVHPGPGHWENTLVHGLLHHCGSSLLGIGGIQRPGIVHRLDRDTSGLMIVAKTEQAYWSLQKQLKDRSLKRVYHALCWGKWIPSFGILQAPIGRNPRNRQRMTVLSTGREAISEYRVLQEWPFPNSKSKMISWVEFSLKTGRTHQIRVHALHWKHAIVGDPVYRGSSTLPLSIPLKRQALHSVQLEFMHPTRQELMIFQCDWPEDLLQFKSSLSTPNSKF
jgi:23S rRNA pseudouridine1911/1915/1917 synthase